VLDRLRTTRLDAALAVAFTVASLVQVVLVPIASPGVGMLYVLGSMLPLAWRRTRPVESSLVSSAFWLIPLDGYPVLGFVVVILQFFALGERGRPRRAVVLVTCWAAFVSVVGTLLGPEPPVAAIGGVLVVVAPVLAGRLVRHQRSQNRALAALADELASERARAEEAAVGAERARIAQELHDVVGHEVTLMAIQAEAAAAALRVSPDRAAEPVEAIRATAHHTLAEIRAVLDVLAPAGEGDRPAVEGAVALADRARAAGIANSLSVTGTPQPDHAPVSLAVARIIREALTNAGRHAPGQPVALQVDWSPAQVNVRATNPTGAHGQPVPGRGLTGMRHRAELLGGKFEAAVADGLFALRVSIPVGEAT
jgi:signal transduction histidine kinase